MPSDGDVGRVRGPPGRQPRGPPQELRAGRRRGAPVQDVGGERVLQAVRYRRGRALHDRHAPAQRHRSAAHGTRDVRHASGHHGAQRAHARPSHAVAPGHRPRARIATQLVVERSLEADGLTREGVGREEFERRTWEWKKEYGGRIGNQIRRLGASCDWSRERFTLDEGLSEAVLEAFVSLHDRGLIYKGNVHGQLGAQAANRRLRPRSGVRRRARDAVLLQVPRGRGRGGRGVPARRHHPPGDHPRRYRGGGEPGG